MKQILPPTAKISKQAKETMQECASEFIAFVTGEASEKCRRDNRKTITGDDLCWALASLGFDDCSYAVMRYLNKFREFEKDKAAATQITTEEHNIINEAPAGPSNSSCKELSFH
ncbi:nuclear transcription factor Y subunit B-5-like, partial [Bidens hawaiensis]|uniref:nuclear transcription factor Y subunit B-5-like n=1 Tax=Bidens hawaiensis TaxID=980011 RepID=UPI00404A7A3E